MREIGRRRLAASLDNGTNARDEARRMEQELTERGVKFVDRGGKEWDPGAYSEMVLRTHTVKVSNQANLNTAAELGSPGVRVFDGGPGDTDLPCAQADGQAWTLGYAATHLLEHPNCRRAFAELPSTFGGGFDRGGGSGGGSGGDGPIGPDEPGGPNGEWFAGGTIDPRKFTEYLFLPDHKDNVGKANGWLRLGLGGKEGDAAIAERLIREQVTGAEIADKPPRAGAKRWEAVIRRFVGANGKTAELLTSWALAPDSDKPHMTTAYPRGRSRGV